MKKFLQKGIVALVAVGIFLMPVSMSFKNGPSLNTNKASAAMIIVYTPKSTGAGESTVTSTSASIYVSLQILHGDNENLRLILTLYKKQGHTVISQQQFKSTGTDIQYFTATFTSLEPNTTYTLHADTADNPANLPTKAQDIEFTTPADSNSYGAGTNTTYNNDGKENDDIGCGWNPKTWFTNCVGTLLYYTVWTPVAAFTSLSAKILDFFVYYSTNSSSYTAYFVDKGWGAMRDVANIFFIIALIYVAIKTILGLGGHDKKLIGYVIIFALLINFSLFTTKVVIDSSNILAKIFYNQIDSKGSNGEAIEPGGQKSITVSLAKIMNPKDTLKNIPGGISNNVGIFIFVTICSIAVLGFMIYVFLSVAILFVSRVVALWIAMIFSPIAFVSYALPFNIPELGHKDWWNELLKNAFLAPIFIFFLYIILMFGRELPGLGGDIISCSTNTNGANTGFTCMLDALVKGLIPFALIIVLLLQAKKLAKTYAGKIGEMVMKGAQTVGGAALGVGLGGAAIAGRATLGRLGSMVANSERLKEAESKGRFGAATLRNIGKVTGKGSMDIRGAKVAGQTLGSFTGMKVNTFGGPQKGGYEKIKADKIKKRQERAKELELGEHSKEKLDLKKAETDLKSLQNYNHHDLEKLDRQIEEQRIIVKDANDARAADPNNKDKVKIAQDATDKLQELKDKKREIKEGGGVVYKKNHDGSFERDAAGNKIAETNKDGSVKYNTNTGYISKQAVDSAIEKATRAENQSTKSGGEASKATSEYQNFVSNEDAKRSEEKTKLQNLARKATEEIDKSILAAKNTESSARNAYANAAQTFGANSQQVNDAQTALDSAVQKVKDTEQAAQTRKASVVSKYQKDLIEAMKKIDDEEVKLKEEMDKAVDIANKDVAEASKRVAEASVARRAFDHALANGGTGRSMKELELEDIPHLHGEIAYIENVRRENYATYISSNTNKALNMLSSGFQHSNEGADEAAYKIRMGMKTESHGGH